MKLLGVISILAIFLVYTRTEAAPAQALQPAERNEIISKASQQATLQETPAQQVLAFRSVVSSLQNQAMRTTLPVENPIYIDASSSRPQIRMNRAIEAIGDVEARDYGRPATSSPPQPMPAIKWHDPGWTKLVNADPDFVRNASELVHQGYSHPEVIGGENDIVGGEPDENPTSPPPTPPVPGSEIDLGAHPQCVAISAGRGIGDFIGSGILLGPSVVLTAKHNIESGSAAFVYEGPTYASEGGEFVALDSSVAPQYFNLPDGSLADVVLLHLKTPIIIDHYDAVATAQDNVAALHSIVLVGYGTTDPTQTGSDNPVRRYVGIPLSPNYCGCHSDFKSAVMLCGIKLVDGKPALGPDMISECRGDSGGPCLTSDGQKVCAVIIKSFPLYPDAPNETECGNGGAYQRVDIFADQINQYLARHL